MIKEVERKSKKSAYEFVCSVVGQQSTRLSDLISGLRWGKYISEMLAKVRNVVGG